MALFLNSKKAKSVFKDGIILGMGGFVGGLQNSFVHSIVSNESLQYFFILIIILSIIKIFISPAEPEEEVKKHSKVTLFIVGFIVGIIAMEYWSWRSDYANSYISWIYEISN